jgi:predicted ATP-dependent endonuclease of OLD family
MVWPPTICEEKMRLISIYIEGYRSFNEPVTLICDRVTVILGANDHGKTNLLHAVTHLNQPNSFEPEIDLNWDRQPDTNTLPCIRFTLLLDREDHAAIKAVVEKKAFVQFAEERYYAARRAYEIAVGEAENLDGQIRELETREATAAKGGATPSPLTELESFVTGHLFPYRLKELKKRQEADASSLEKLRSNLLEAIISSVTASFLSARTADSPAISLALSMAQDDAEKASVAHQLAVDKLNTARSILEEVRADNDNLRILEATRQVADAEREVATAISAADAARYNGLLNDAAQHFITGKFGDVVGQEFEKHPVELPKTLQAERLGSSGGLRLALDSKFDYPETLSLLESRLPRVELIGPVDKLADFATRTDIDREEFAFMRGVFYYAGLDKAVWDSIFEQNDVTARQLERASERLNKSLGESWSQGRELTFKLQHSSGGRIELYILDPVIKDRYVRASRRSTGFTHFFTLKTILHSRQMEAPASSYIWLFDEPGLYLHPTGQQDLLQVLETLALSNQVLYSTHSLFMINKNYPARHRLLVKQNNGTRMDGKPFHGRWRSAIDALGLSLPATILFASRILLVEGDSDPILLNAVLIKLIEIGRLSADLNTLAIIPTGDSKNADALIRLLNETPSKPKLAALFDGDEGGKARRSKLAEVFKSFSVNHRCLADGTTLEDHLLKVNTIFVDALSDYLVKIAKEPNNLREKVAEAFTAKYRGTEGKSLLGVAEWSREVGKQLARLDSEPSPVGIAREYALRLAETLPSTIDDDDCTRAEGLADWIVKSLDLPKQALTQDTILERV